MTNTKASFDKRIGKIVDGLETKFEKITKVLQKDKALAILHPPVKIIAMPSESLMDFWNCSRCTLVF